MGKRIITAAISLVLAACGGDNGGQPSNEEGLGNSTVTRDTITSAVMAAPPAAAGTATAADSATATMRDSSGRELGTVSLSGSGKGVQLRGQITGLTQGEHGIHLHTVGQCEPNFDAAGDHWNPSGKRHGRLGQGHAGDLGNINAGANGTAQVQMITGGGISLAALLEGDGTAVVIHAQPDDLQTDPSGNSGARIACGVVQRG